MPAGHRPGTFLGALPADAGHRYISDTRLSSPSTRARHVPDGRPYCSPWITRGEGGPPMRGGSQLKPTVQLTEAPALHRSLRQKTRPLPPDQKPTPASTHPGQSPRTITSDVCFMVNCIWLLLFQVETFCVPQSSL